MDKSHEQAHFQPPHLYTEKSKGLGNTVQDLSLHCISEQTPIACKSQRMVRGYGSNKEGYTIGVQSCRSSYASIIGCLKAPDAGKDWDPAATLHVTDVICDAIRPANNAFKGILRHTTTNAM